MTDVRKGQGDVKLTREQFERRLRERFYDPEYASVSAVIGSIADVAWRAYDEYHKSPRTRKAGPDFANPDFELPIEWLDARAAIQRAERAQKDPATPSRVLLVSGAARHDQTCPGEMSKTVRLVQLAREEIERPGVTCDVLDLSLLTAQYGRQILPCKACVSTAMPLCDWPRSCYVGYDEPYATSHDALDGQVAFHEEVRNAARTPVEAVRLQRAGQWPRADRDLRPPRPK